MHLVRSLFFFLAEFNIPIDTVHSPGKQNVAADSLSWDDFPSFFQVVPTASRTPTPLPPELLEALVHHQPDWRSASWRIWFGSTLGKD